MAEKTEAGVAKAHTVRSHQPGQDVFRAVLSEDIEWQPFPAFPPSVRLAVVVGKPSEAGPYTIRVKVPHDVKLMPHRHPEDRVYTVISGVFYIGVGDQFDAREIAGLSARQRRRVARRYASFSLGEIERVCDTSVGDWAARLGLCGFEGRSEEQQVVRGEEHRIALRGANRPHFRRRYAVGRSKRRPYGEKLKCRGGRRFIVGAKAPTP